MCLACWVGVTALGKEMPAQACDLELGAQRGLCWKEGESSVPRIGLCGHLLLGDLGPSRSAASVSSSVTVSLLSTCRGGREGRDE